MTWIAVGVMAVGTAISTGMSMYAQYQQGKAQEAMYQAQADQAAEEARIAKLKASAQADLIQDQGKAEGKKLKRQQLKLLGKQKAALAAMGISGVTAEDIMSDTLQVQDMDEATLHYNADQATWEAKTTGDYNSWALQNEAAMHRASKINTRKATRTAVTSTLINGVVSIGGTVATGGASKGMKTPSSGYARAQTGKFNNVKNLAVPRTYLT